MSRYSFALLAVAVATAPALAQAPANACATPDSIAVRGNSRVEEATIRREAGLARDEPLNYRAVQRAIEALFATGQFSDVRLDCEVSADARATLLIHVQERPLLGGVEVTGIDILSERSVRDQIDLVTGRPLDPALVAQAVQRIDSLYEASGYYLARVRPETTVVNDRINLAFRIDEGGRLSVSGIEIDGNRRISGGDIVGAMKTRPEGFWWFRKGEFDEDEYATDLGYRIPQLYADRGFIDFRVARDTLLIDRERGKALIRVRVDEGSQYRVGSFEVVGNRRFNTSEIRQYFPFTKEDPSITDRIKGLFGGGGDGANVFDQSEWEDATNSVRTAYSNEGYIYASVRPVVERATGADSVPIVNLRWEIDEKTPATVNRVDIIGNDYTTESCIRDVLVLLPGDVFNQDRLIRSYQNISNLGFFEQPLPPPDTRPVNDEGDVDVIFRVKERRTGNVNFGASVGQGTGLGGFLGLDQPNLFGQCKRASLQWQFGRYINDFNLSYTDPAIRQSRISGTATAYHTRSRFTIADLGRQTRTGGSLQFGFPVPNSPYTRLFVSYGGERVSYGGGLFDRDTAAVECDGCFRSTLGFTATHDTRIDLPFATAGGLQTVSAQFNGGPLGGNSSFQRYTTELRAYAPLGQLGGDRPGAQPIKFVFGLTGRAGAVFGDVGPFFVSQKFSLGGTQFGETLRGYNEFSITPEGFVDTDNDRARRESFGNAFFTTTAELGVRFNQSLYANVFFDAGNIWDRPRDFDPTRLFRGAGIGVALVTPLGPLGLDWAYGFDRLDEFGQPDPKWQLHFRLGNIF
jgi:outer membrane protein insertion porin family